MPTTKKLPTAAETAKKIIALAKSCKTKNDKACSRLRVPSGLIRKYSGRTILKTSFLNSLSKSFLQSKWSFCKVDNGSFYIINIKNISKWPLIVDQEGDNCKEMTLRMSKIESNNVYKLNLVLKELGADINTKNNDGLTFLMYATQSNLSAEFIKLLLDAGSDVNATDENNVTPLMYAITHNANIEVIRMLLKAGADIEAEDYYLRTPLILAALHNDNPQVITTLLDAGANLYADDEEEMTSLQYAAKQSKSPDVMRVLWEAYEKDVHDDYDEQLSYLIRLAMENNVGVFSILLELYLTESRGIDARNERGMTILMNAARFAKDHEIITEICEYFPDIEAKDEDGITPLMYASRYNNNAIIVSRLIHSGADIEASDNNGMTPFMYATKFSSNPSVALEFLMQFHKYDNIRDKFGKNALDYASENKHCSSEMVKRIKTFDYDKYMEYMDP